MCPNRESFLVRIQSEYRKIRTRNNSVFGHFSRSESIWYTRIWKPFLHKQKSTKRNLENSQNLNFPYFTLTYFKVKRISKLALIYFDLFIFFSFFFRNISWKRSHKTWNVRLCRKFYLHVTYIPYWFLLHKISFKITASSKRCIIDWFVWW